MTTRIEKKCVNKFVFGTLFIVDVAVAIVVVVLDGVAIISAVVVILVAATHYLGEIKKT